MQYGIISIKDGNVSQNKCKNVPKKNNLLTIDSKNKNIPFIVLLSFYWTKPLI